ncbi:hypothetical protein AMECASPLE_037851 [Ameca splendens]|uniref:Uncharacterized protein n=1 Tax=Ameca splendens TaxID=208324 RepID=A0ABV0ZGS1_9TELE
MKREYFLSITSPYLSVFCAKDAICALQVGRTSTVASGLPSPLPSSPAFTADTTSSPIAQSLSHSLALDHHSSFQSLLQTCLCTSCTGCFGPFAATQVLSSPSCFLAVEV